MMLSTLECLDTRRYKVRSLCLLYFFFFFLFHRHPTRKSKARFPNRQSTRIHPIVLYLKNNIQRLCTVQHFQTLRAKQEIGQISHLNTRAAGRMEKRLPLPLTPGWTQAGENSQLLTLVHLRERSSGGTAVADGTPGHLATVATQLYPIYPRVSVSMCQAECTG